MLFGLRWRNAWCMHEGGGLPLGGGGHLLFPLMDPGDMLGETCADLAQFTSVGIDAGHTPDPAHALQIERVRFDAVLGGILEYIVRRPLHDRPVDKQTPPQRFKLPKLGTPP